MPDRQTQVTEKDLAIESGGSLTLVVGFCIIVGVVWLVGNVLLGVIGFWAWGVFAAAIFVAAIMRSSAATANGSDIAIAQTVGDTKKELATGSGVARTSTYLPRGSDDGDSGDGHGDSGDGQGDSGDVQGDSGDAHGGSGGSHAPYVGLGVGTAVTVGAMLVGNALLPGIGFAAGGVVAKSWAASMMSSAAIANGGSIAAGSGIAIAQSIGATGVSLATGATAGAGAGAAGGILTKAAETLFGWAKAKKKVTKEDKQTQTDH